MTAILTPAHLIPRERKCHHEFMINAPKQAEKAKQLRAAEALLNIHLFFKYSLTKKWVLFFRLLLIQSIPMK